MEITIDALQQYIINTLREGQKRSKLHTTELSWAKYDVYLGHAVQGYLRLMGMPDPNNNPTALLGKNFQETEKIRQNQTNITRLLADVFWRLCMRGILRPGESHIGSSHAQVRSADEGYAVTEYGEQWLMSCGDNDLLPADPGRLAQIYSKFQSLFGASYFRRAKEAVSCFFSGNYLACCVMCGAATESMLLTIGFAIKDKDEILKLYNATGGRRKLEKCVFGQVRQELQQRYKDYTALISYLA